jgi:hypothetical protein
VDSGVEESYGIAASASSKLFAEIAAATTWPLSVDLSDLDGNRVASHVSALVISGGSGNGGICCRVEPLHFCCRKGAASSDT